MSKLCVICGKEIYEKRNTKRKYCSEACLRAAETKKKIGLIAKRVKAIAPIAHSVYKAYDYKCALCGWQATSEVIVTNTGMQHAHGNEIHHIIPVSQGGTEKPDNLILLCPNHHKQADLGIISREELQAHVVNYLQAHQNSLLNNPCADTIAKEIF